jgi:hypothetical protein
MNEEIGMDIIASLSTEESTTVNHRAEIAGKSGKDHFRNEDSQLALEVRALAELLLDIFEYRQERKKPSGPSQPSLDATPERHTM